MCCYACSSERSKYDLRVRSYRNDKKQLDSELDKAIQRLKENADRDELMAFDNEISLDQVHSCLSGFYSLGASKVIVKNLFAYSITYSGSIRSAELSLVTE